MAKHYSIATRAQVVNFAMISKLKYNHIPKRHYGGGYLQFDARDGRQKITSAMKCVFPCPFAQSRPDTHSPGRNSTRRWVRSVGKSPVTVTEAANDFLVIT